MGKISVCASSEHHVERSSRWKYLVACVLIRTSRQGDASFHLPYPSQRLLEMLFLGGVFEGPGGSFPFSSSAPQTSKG